MNIDTITLYDANKVITKTQFLIKNAKNLENFVHGRVTIIPEKNLFLVLQLYDGKDWKENEQINEILEECIITQHFLKR